KPGVTLASEEQHATLGSLPNPYTRSGSHTASEIHGGEALTGVRRGQQDACKALRYPTVNPPLRAVRRGVKGQYTVFRELIERHRITPLSDLLPDLLQSDKPLNLRFPVLVNRLFVVRVLTGPLNPALKLPRIDAPAAAVRLPAQVVDDV